MSTFGEKFGELIKQRRGIEGLSQKDLAILAFDDEAYKTRISDLENGKIKRPHAKTIDAYIVALNIPEHELDELLHEAPHPSFYDNLTDFFEVPKNSRLDIEIGISDTGCAVFRYSFPLKTQIKRLEFFVEERTLIWVTEEQKRRPVGLPLTQDLSSQLRHFSKIRFIHHDLQSDKRIDHGDYSLKIID